MARFEPLQSAKRRTVTPSDGARSRRYGRFRQPAAQQGAQLLLQYRLEAIERVEAVECQLERAIHGAMPLPERLKGLPLRALFELLPPWEKRTR
ncbi:hypothetical protein A6A40_24490 (plasmid) [Azospirillum humicireducens]|uniref:Uncharacterized protein n=1 Tax=Azospirillum humicireducens TaxID=1226968 RepID=A0A2R4VUS5_9PROT|nr:hypothetical protein [Azospirillum humicireducens]AWB08187.1 hypothetical protein A6A40_24490 [Azospirillum humicireducens]